MRYVADERAERSARRLTKAHANVLRRWAGARRKAWGISDACSVSDVAALILERRRSGKWEQLGFVLRDVSKADEAIRSCCHVYERFGEDDPRAAYRYVGSRRATTVDEMHSAMRSEMPSLTREKLRKVLHKANREGSIHRVKRGLYIHETWNMRRWEETREMEEDESHQRWHERYERRSFICALVLVVHYLLPRRASYRKAKEIGIADRTYFYCLAEALEDFATTFEHDPDSRRPWTPS